MKKIFISIFIIALSLTFVSAETSKAKDNNKVMTDEEFLRQFTALNKEEKDIKNKTLKMEKKLEKTKQIGKTLDEINSLIDLKHKEQKWCRWLQKKISKQ